MHRVLCAALIVSAGTSMAVGQLYSNGPLATGVASRSGVAAPAGAQWSERQSDLGNFAEANFANGYLHYLAGNSNRRKADDFTVPVGQTWEITSIDFWAYKSNAPAAAADGASPVGQVYVQILDAAPNQGGNVIWGDLVTDRLESSVFGGIYRIVNTTTPAFAATDLGRAMWRSRATVGTTLPAGTYWIEWTYLPADGAGQLASPTVTVVDSRAPLNFANGLETSAAGVWQRLFDQGNPASAPDVDQEFPFVINGNGMGDSINPVGAPGASPKTVTADGSVTSLITVAVQPGLQPTSASFTVTADLSAVGGSAMQSLMDDGMNGDAVAGDNVFSFVLAASGGTAGVNYLPYTVTDDQLRTAQGFVTILLAGTPATTTNEVEPNDVKASANAITLQPGQGIVGNTVGAAATGGADSIDTYRISTAASNGLMLNTLTLVSTTAGHTMTLRGLTQSDAGAGNPGVINAGTNATITTGVGLLGARELKWYSHGGSNTPSVFVSVAGAAATTANYVLTLTSEAVTPEFVGAVEGPDVTFSTLGQTTVDTDFWVYDSGLTPVALAGNDDESVLSGGTGTTTRGLMTRELRPGTYYFAVAPFNLVNNLASPGDDDFRTGSVLDFPGVTACSNATFNTNVSFALTGTADPLFVSATRRNPFEIAWFAFEVTGFCPADFNQDGGVDGDDVIAFFAAWDSGDLAADFNGDGGVDGDDVIGFFGRWDANC